MNRELPFEGQQRTGSLAKDRLVRVALPVPLNKLFDYSVPKELAMPSAGTRVSVPFGARSLVGVVTGCTHVSEIQATRIKDVESVLDVAQPAMSSEHLQLAQWMARYYHEPLGQVVATTLPAELKRQKRDPAPRKEFAFTLTDEGRAVLTGTGDELSRAPKQLSVLRTLADHGGTLKSVELAALVDGGWREPMRALRNKGLVLRYDARYEVPALEPAPSLIPEQQAAYDALAGRMDRFGVHVIDGVTGSGKTEVYLRLIDDCIKAGRQALLLIPEIALAPQTVDRLRRRINGRVAASHSALTDAERADVYRRAQTGDIRVVIGTRSAVFTDFKDLGLIVVDEEHDTSYKQQDGVRYHARDVAVKRGQLCDVPVVLGSATLSLETVSRCDAGAWDRYELNERATGAKMPVVEIVDTKEHPAKQGLTRPLVEEIRQTLARDEQVLLFLNRRGFSPVLLCGKCGETTECRHCSATMTYHMRVDALKCHHCGVQTPKPAMCSACGGRGTLQYIGEGTERVEELLRAQFPGAPLWRVDRDTTRRRGSLEATLSEVREGHAGILLGTQMLAQGHDLPRVTLVGLLNVDQMMCMPDLRAMEQFGMLLTQTMGRAGRADLPGKVMLQTKRPGDGALRTLLERGYRCFARELLAQRREERMPPATHAINLRCESASGEEALFILRTLQERGARYFPNVLLRGPAPALVERVMDRWRYHLLLSCADRRPLHEAAHDLIAVGRDLARSSRRDIRFLVDVDPAAIC